MSPTTASSFVMLSIAPVLHPLGRWGRRTVPRLVSPYRPEEERVKRIRTLRRGGVVCHARHGVFVR